LILRPPHQKINPWRITYRRKEPDLCRDWDHQGRPVGEGGRPPNGKGVGACIRSPGRVNTRPYKPLSHYWSSRRPSAHTIHLYNPLLFNLSLLSTFFTILAIILLLIGLIGSIAPILPWPILGLAWLLLLEFVTPVDFSITFLLLMSALTLLAMATDYLLPILWTKKYGGSKRGIRGSTIGLILGIFIIPPRGMIIFPLLGAFAGEMLVNQSTKKSRKVAYGTFVWSMLSTIIKLITTGLMLRYAIATIR